MSRPCKSFAFVVLLIVTPPPSFDCTCLRELISEDIIGCNNKPVEAVRAQEASAQCVWNTSDMSNKFLKNLVRSVKKWWRCDCMQQPTLNNRAVGRQSFTACIVVALSFSFVILWWCLKFCEQILAWICWDSCWHTCLSNEWYWIGIDVWNGKVEQMKNNCFKIEWCN